MMPSFQTDAIVETRNVSRNTKDLLNQFDSPFVDGLGIERVKRSADECEIVLPLKQAHLNTWEIAHGGISMTLSDVALALAACSGAASDTGVVTMELKVSFLQPGREILYSKGRVLHRFRRIADCEGEIVDGEGRLVAKALGTFRYIKRTPAVDHMQPRTSKVT
ncbi:thioesterase [Caballeronia pedi]|uniref:Thioesterase n=1 Tax=Caballeronia pedi TaxID=1777141 RepID=A0A158DK25_9BURK|nr:PaaI family thioesterase [Caballeronia pedi]SAK95002.1 thioesterase [Caballeronia pedi]